MQEQYHDYNKVKGFCPVCNAWRAFVVYHAVMNTQSYYSIGQSTPLVEQIGNGYSGKCSKGHLTVFTMQEKPRVPSYKREPLWLLVMPERDEKAKNQYLAWLRNHRDWKREEHFNDPYHECNEECPEFDWSIYDDFDYRKDVYSMGKYNKEDGVLRPMKSKKWFYRRNKRVIDYFITDTVADDLTNAYEQLNELATGEVIVPIVKVETHPDGWVSRFKHWLGGK